MIDAGVPAGPTKPFQPITSTPGRPDCAIVGILRVPDRGARETVRPAFSGRLLGPVTPARFGRSQDGQEVISARSRWAPSLAAEVLREERCARPLAGRSSRASRASGETRDPYPPASVKKARQADMDPGPRCARPG